MTILSFFIFIIATNLTYAPLVALTIPSDFGIAAARSQSVENSFHQSLKTTSRIVGGSSAPLAVQRRHVFLISFFRDKNIRPVPCSGSVIGSEFVLTAAHCVLNKRRPAYAISIYVNRKNLPQPSNDTYDTYARTLFVHKEYRNIFRADIAIIQSEHRLATFGAKTIHLHHHPNSAAPSSPNTSKQITLPSPGSRLSPRPTLTRTLGGSNPKVDILEHSPTTWWWFNPTRKQRKLPFNKPFSSVYAAGFGRTSTNGTFSDVLLQTRMKLPNETACLDAERRFVRQLNQTSHLCAAAPGFPSRGEQDTCFGDSGGPLFARQVRRRPQQIGVTSWGPVECGLAGDVTWYTSIETYYADIMDVLRNGRRARRWFVQS